MEKRPVLTLFAVFLIVIIGLLLINYNSTKKLNQIQKQQEQILSDVRMMKKRLLTQPNDDLEEISVSDIGKIREKLTKLQSQLDYQDEILGLLDASTSAITPTPLLENGFVSIKDRKWPSVDVFAEKNSSSKIVGQIIYGKSYPFLKKEGDYYLIRLNQNVSGWIHNQFIKEY